MEKLRMAESLLDRVQGALMTQAEALWPEASEYSTGDLGVVGEPPHPLLAVPYVRAHLGDPIKDDRYLYFPLERDTPESEWPVIASTISGFGSTPSNSGNHSPSASQT